MGCGWKSSRGTDMPLICPVCGYVYLSYMAPCPYCIKENDDGKPTRYMAEQY